MSSSFLKPSVTPVTALATRLRARPWNFRGVSSRSSLATSASPSLANRMPGGVTCRSLPFGPCTSTAPASIVTVTPLGSVMGFLPIRDMVRSLPNSAEHFAADARLLGGAAGHHAARRRQDAGAEPAEHGGHVLDAEVHPAPGTADALQPGDHFLALRAVAQEHPNLLATRLA